MWSRWWRRRPGEPPADPVAADPRARDRREHGLSAEDEALLDRIAAAVIRWGMAVPAVFLLESSKPLSFVGSQFLHFLSPIVHSVLDAREMDRLAAMLERRDTVERLIIRIERAEAARDDPRGR